MPRLLNHAPIPPAVREAHDRHNAGVVLLVLLVLAVHFVLLGYVEFGEEIDPWEYLYPMGRDPAIDESREDIPEERLVFLDLWEAEQAELFREITLVIAGAFLTSYLLPVRRKRPVMTCWGVLGVAVLYGSAACAGLLAAHALVYAVLHPRRGIGLPLLAGALAAGAFLPYVDGPRLVLALVVGVASWIVAYRTVVLPLLARPRAAGPIRAMVVHSAVIVAFSGSILFGEREEGWVLPLALLLFFWQWCRVIMYHADYRDGKVPSGITFWQYLSVFMVPAMVPYYDWGTQIGQGYVYTEATFLSQDKNRIVLRGVGLMTLGLAYLLAWPWFVLEIVDFCESNGIAVYEGVMVRMLDWYAAGNPVTTASVLVVSLIDLSRWFLLFAMMVHFKVGVWRILGYDVDPYFDKPWLATNLGTFWMRFTYHYREFLFRIFYYPVFQRLGACHPVTRIVLATFAAAAWGNLVWGHVPESALDEGLKLSSVYAMLHAWPYFLLLAGGIAVAQVYRYFRRPKRKPWTPGPRIALDVLCAYVTIQFYALIEIFIRPGTEATLGDRFRLFLTGFGIPLG